MTKKLIGGTGTNSSVQWKYLIVVDTPRHQKFTFPNLTNQKDSALICRAQEPFVHKHVFFFMFLSCLIWPPHPKNNQRNAMVITSLMFVYGTFGLRIHPTIRLKVGHHSHYHVPRNPQRSDPRFTDPEKTWVSNSSSKLLNGVRWDSVPFNFWWTCLLNWINAKRTVY